MSNIQTVQTMYEAFSRGDVAAILSHLSDHVEWEYGSHGLDVPWLQKRNGRAGAAAFFASLAALDIHRFEPQSFFEQQDTVVVLLDFDCTVKATGKRIHEEDAVHIFRFDGQGEVSRFRHRIDTYHQVLAYRG